MKKIAITISMGGLMLGLYSCHPKTPKDGPTFTKETALKQYSDEQLMAGKALFETNCNKCHKLFDPASKTDLKWNPTLNRMVPRTKLNDADGQLVRAYIVANSKDAE